MPYQMAATAGHSQVAGLFKSSNTCTAFLPERDYVTFGSLLSQFRLSSVVCRLSVVCNVGAPYSGG